VFTTPLLWRRSRTRCDPAIFLSHRLKSASAAVESIVLSVTFLQRWRSCLPHRLKCQQSLPCQLEHALHLNADIILPELDMGPIFLTRPNPTHKCSDPTRPTENGEFCDPTPLDPTRPMDGPEPCPTLFSTVISKLRRHRFRRLIARMLSCDRTEDVIICYITVRSPGMLLPVFCLCDV